MKHIKLYRVIGGLLLTYGAVVYPSGLVYRIFYSGIVSFYPAFFALIIAFGLNCFIWIGIILLWRADANERPHEKSNWLKFIIFYGIFTSIAAGVFVSQILLPCLSKG